MDSLSQIVLGAAVGEAVLGKKIGNKALLWGAVCGTIPDLDTIPGQFMDTVSRLEVHRGFSHSIVFAVLLAPIMGFGLNHLYRKKEEADWWGWTQLVFWAVITHPLLDVFTTWGTQLFWPFDWRLAIESVFVIDPLYTLPFLICCLLLFFFKRNHVWRRRINAIGLIWSSSYLLLTVVVKLNINRVFVSSLKAQEIEFTRYTTRPSPFNTLLWTSNVETEDAFLIGYYSLLDQGQEVDFYPIPKRHDLLTPYRNHPDIERLLFLTKGFYAMNENSDGLEMYDLRFGLSEGFDKGKGDFIFTYLIQGKGEDLEIIQKPNNLEGMNRVLVKLFARIKGKKDFD